MEWAHAIAPGANILLVEAASASVNDLLSAVNYARSQAGVSVVSMSWGAGEFSGETAYDSVFTTPVGHAGVTFVASSGDQGAPASWPAIASNVVAVGGTTLSLSAAGGYAAETGWSGSGGGYSRYEPEPAFQRAFQTTGHRSNPDVAYDADPYSGFYVNYNSTWYAVGGTSAGAPQWAGLIAIANQGRAAAGRAPLSTALQAIYGLSGADFHDVTAGNNGYAAGAGYNVVTGRGSPLANYVVRDLVNYGAVAVKPVMYPLPPTPAQKALSGKLSKADVSANDQDFVFERFSAAAQNTTAIAAEQIAEQIGGQIGYRTADASSLTTTAVALSIGVDQGADATVDASPTNDPSAVDPDSGELAGDSCGNQPGALISGVDFPDAANAADGADAACAAAARGAAGHDISPLPAAAFEASDRSAADPLGVIDRVERFLDRYFAAGALGPTAALPLDPAHIDACLADASGMIAHNRLESAEAGAKPSDARGATPPLTAAALCLLIDGGWTRGAPAANDAESRRRR